MEAVFCRIAQLSDEYERRPFFQLLEGSGDAAAVRALAPALTFFVFAFQDILRLNAGQVTDPVLAGVARQHLAEDAGHQNWFLHDVRCLGVEPDIEWTFGREHRITRDTSYRLVSEVFRASDDRVRVVVPVVLEVTGHAFFRRIFHFCEGAGVGATLKYFARTHWHVEQGHQMLQDDQVGLLRQLSLPDPLRVECFGLVERMFDAMATFVDDLHARMVTSKGECSVRRAGPSHSRTALD